MNEPILSREEVTSIWRNCMKRSAQEFIDGLLESGVPKGEILPVVFADALESALLGKLCGEPVAWQIRRISGNGTMDEREMFEATLVELSQRDEETFDKPFPDDDINVLWALWQAARRTTPDREASDES